MSSLITGSLHLKEKKKRKRKNAELNLPSWASSFGNRPKAIIPKRAYSNNRFFPIVHKSIGIDSWKNKTKLLLSFWEEFTPYYIHYTHLKLCYSHTSSLYARTCTHLQWHKHIWLLFIHSSVITLDSLIMFCYQIIGLKRSIF